MPARDSGLPRPKKGRRPTKQELKAARVAIWPDDALCPLCGREMVAGHTLNEHHLVPRSYGGTERYIMHRVCHSKIHSVFSEAELAYVYNTFEKLREQPAIRSFVKWVRKQNPEHMTKHRRPN
jgi:5-methylcytosine-specific restriction endonuclease McrA